MKNVRCLLFLAFICFGRILLAGDFNLNYNYQLLGLGQTQVHNSFLSPLSFQGGAVCFDLGSFKRKKAQLRSISIEGSIASLSNANEISSLSQTEFSFSYNRYLPIDQNLVSDLEFYVGAGYRGALDLLSNTYNINNAMYYDFSNVLTLGFYACYATNGYHFSNQLSVPVLGAYSCSNYASSFPYTFYEDDLGFMSQVLVGSFNYRTCIYNKFNFDLIAKTKRKVYNLRFSYYFTYCSSNMNNISYQRATHQLGIAYLFSRKHHEY